MVVGLALKLRRHVVLVFAVLLALAGAGLVSAHSAEAASLDYEVAFQANTGSLWSIGSDTHGDWSQGMMPGTSPSITALAGGGYEMAFQANTGSLITIGSAGNRNWQLGMKNGTSPSIAGLSNGGFEVAFQANTGSLWSIGSDTHGDWSQGMMPGTSPSITALAGGGYEMAFQANTGSLITIGSAGNRNWQLGMKNGTSPSIAGLSNGGFEVAFQANTGSLWSIGSDTHGDWSLGMLDGTSPAIAGKVQPGTTPAGTTGPAYTTGGFGAGGSWSIPIPSAPSSGCPTMQVAPLQPASGIPTNYQGPLFVDGAPVSGCFGAARSLAGYANVGGSDNAPHAWGSGLIQNFSRGAWGPNAIMKSNSSDLAFVVRSGIWEAFRNQGGPTTIGYPIGNEYSVTDGAVQLFERGMIVWRNGAGKFVSARTPNDGGAAIQQYACDQGYSSRGYAGRNCTDYAAWRLATDGHPIPGGKGNGADWGVTLPRDLGWTVDTTPRPGDIAWSTSGPYGHVAYVNAVNADGSLQIEDYNRFAKCTYHLYPRESLRDFRGFIHPPLTTW